MVLQKQENFCKIQKRNIFGCRWVVSQNLVLAGLEHISQSLNVLPYVLQSVHVLYQGLGSQ